MPRERQRARPKLCFVAASPVTVQAFLSPHVRRVVERYDVTVLTDLDGLELSSVKVPKATLRHVPISRRVDVVRDVIAAIQLVRFFKAENFDAVISVSPKAGFLTAIAGHFARVPVRVHWFTGQVWATKRNPYRFVLKFADRVIASLATSLLADSRSQRDFLVSERVFRREACEVLLEGSISGVDTQRFRPNDSARTAVRAELGIPGNAVVVIFIGRINRDKGVLDMAHAIPMLETQSLVHTVWVGVDEEGLVPTLQNLMSSSGVTAHFVGPSNSPERYLAASDLLCLPSYREGFGTSVLEAAAAGVPSVVSNVYGLSDAVITGETGVVFPVGNIPELSACIQLLVDHDGLRHKLGRGAQARALRDFRQEDITSEFDRYILREMDKAGAG